MATPVQPGRSIYIHNLTSTWLIPKSMSCLYSLLGYATPFRRDKGYYEWRPVRQLLGECKG